MPTPQTRRYQNGFSGEVREVTQEDWDWYEKNGAPWYRVEPVLAPEPLPPSQRAAKAKPTKS